MFQEHEVLYTQQGLHQQNEERRENDRDDKTIPENDAKGQFSDFIRNFQQNGRFLYRDQLNDNVHNQIYTLEIQLQDFNAFKPQLYEQFALFPSKYLSVFESAMIALIIELNNIDTKNFQLNFNSSQEAILFRQLRSDKINQLVNIRGIVINSQRTYIKPKELAVQCVNCGHKKLLPSQNGLQGALVPSYCLAKQENIRSEISDKCPLNPYQPIPEESVMVDQQEVKIQESPESVPTGEIPRNFRCVVDRSLVGKLIPGMRVKAVGVFTVIQQSVSSAKGLNNQMATKLPYIQIIGFTQEDASRRQQANLTEDQIAKFQQMSKDPKIYEKLAKAIAPAIFGREDIKKAILLQLLGGNRKKLQSSMNLRGDINVLLIGDPSTAKSQMLKFAERAAPIGVYTSGKGSSAAGLTASIGRDSTTGQFQIEGGAMVLADGGLVCIDEFDKMKSEDRIAIHEAMEQQTISIAKAGITTRLNTRCSVLAAANPIFGSYHDLKQIEEQIELQTTILSRFDCIFIVKDDRSKLNDTKMAQKILSLHTNNGLATDEVVTDHYDLETLKGYIAYARSHCAPKLSNDSNVKIRDMYVEDRKKSLNNGTSSKSRIPVTVRQLEAVIRLSEARAKAEMAKEVTFAHIDEAHRLFQVSTISAITNGREVIGQTPYQLKPKVEQVKLTIKRKLQIGARYDYTKLKEELSGLNDNSMAIEHALLELLQAGDLKQESQKRFITRVK